jgi:hypothetical protein
MTLKETPEPLVEGRTLPLLAITATGLSARV